MIRIRIDRDRTLALTGNVGWRRQYSTDLKLSVVAEIVSPITMFRIVDEREIRDILRTGVVRGGSFSTPDERRHGASWASSADGLIAWGRGWQKRRLGANLYLLELPNAAGKIFYHMAPVLSPPFDPFGNQHQLSSMDESTCSTGLGCSISNVLSQEIYFYRVKPNGKIAAVEPSELAERQAKKPQKTIDLTEVASGIYYTGWIHGHSVIVLRDQTRENRYGELTRRWDVIWRKPDGREVLVVTDKKSRKAAIDSAAALLERRP